MRRILSLLLALFPVRAACQPLFPCAERLQSPYGVCTHITRPGWDYEIRDRELQLLAETGIRWVRSDLDFHRFFTSPTATDPAVFSRVLDSTEGHGEHLLGILTWQGSYPWDDARYGWRVAELARTFDRRITHWEVLNEVNLFRGVDSLCPRYVSTLRLAYETLKRVNPSNVVLSSGFGELPEPFISDFSSLGGWRYCDVFNFHSYFTPEGLIPCFERLHGYMQRDGWKRPVWVTECGMHTARDRTSSADFFTSLLPAALARLGIRERKVCVGVLRNPATGYSALYDDEASLLLAPYCRRVRYIDFAALETLDVRRTPVLVATRDEYFPRSCQPALVDYVRRGGTIVLAGGMPFYYDANTPEGTYFDRRERGTRDYAALHMAAMVVARAAGTSARSAHPLGCHLPGGIGLCMAVWRAVSSPLSGRQRLASRRFAAPPRHRRLRELPPARGGHLSVEQRPAWQHYFPDAHVCYAHPRPRG